jgi:hypothetical protein
MNDGQRRRHVRDIAHLYISGARHREPAPRLCLVIAGADRGCFPGFHAANLAAALAVRGCEVRLHERSGLLPNAGFYFSLPPSQYIRWEDSEGETDSGLAGVTLDCSRGALRIPRGDWPRARIDLLHLPPLTEKTRAMDYFGLSGEEGPGPPVVVLLVGGETVLDGIPAGFLERFEPDTVLVFHTTESGAAEREAGRAADPPLSGIGAATGWETALADRVSVVIRVPDSGLATAYFAAADALRFKMDELRRTIVGPASAQGSAGLRSGSADRRPDGEGTVLPISRFGTRHTRRSSG